jgi:hypothetical protein
MHRQDFNFGVRGRTRASYGLALVAVSLISAKIDCPHFQRCMGYAETWKRKQVYCWLLHDSIDTETASAKLPAILIHTARVKAR